MKLARLGESPEIFHSLQGEGISLGKPAVFVRLALCNLRCHWCDTSYTWKWPYKDSSRYLLSIPPREVARLISDFPCTHLVITGGEPLLQCDKIVELMELLPYHTLEIETNGTLIPSPELDSRASQYNVSPKLLHSGNPSKTALKAEALRWFTRCDKSWFKFVVNQTEDINEVAEWEQAHNIPHDRILLMPRGTTPEELNETLPMLAEECLKRNYRLTDRLHIHLWGNKPGV